MHDKPILFSTPMVQKIQKNEKSVTRRLTGLNEINKDPDNWIFEEIGMLGGDLYAKFHHKESGKIKRIKAPYIPGDLIYVQETWQISALSSNCNMTIKYKADNSERKIQFDPSRFDKFEKFFYKNGWQSPYFMPKEAARFFQECKDIRIERLQDITDEDIVKEGVVPSPDDLDDALCNYCPLDKSSRGTQGTPNGYTTCEGFSCSEAYESYIEENARDLFSDLWDSLNKDRGYGFDKNSWLWVIPFGQIKK
jgi:hypothetical protein